MKLTNLPNHNHNRAHRNMGSLVFLIWGIGMISPFNVLITLLTVAAIVGVVITAIWLMCNAAVDWKYDRYDDIEKKQKLHSTQNTALQYWLKFSIVGFIFAMLINILVPTERTAWMMVGVLTAEKLLENPAVKETSANVLNLINAKIKQETNSVMTEIKAANPEPEAKPKAKPKAKPEADSAS